MSPNLVTQGSKPQKTQKQAKPSNRVNAGLPSMSKPCQGLSQTALGGGGEGAAPALGHGHVTLSAFVLIMLAL